MENGEHAMENGEHAMENSEHAMENGEHAMESGEHAMENGEHVMENGEHVTDKSEVETVIETAALENAEEVNGMFDNIKDFFEDILTMLGASKEEIETIEAEINPCADKTPAGFDNSPCMDEDGNVIVAEQAGANVTKGYKGEREAFGTPITVPYSETDLCPVNVHWHLGTEHYSLGEYDENGSGPYHSDDDRRHLVGDVRMGYQCNHYDESDPKFTTEYEWEHCVDMEVGETYEIHWPHSAAGACGTPWQYQTPFYNGVFCTDGVISISPLNTYSTIGVQGQVFTIVNDEEYYYDDLFSGMIVDGEEKGTDMAYYTGSTTGTSRDNEICSNWAPITWQVDRKCHLISASSFDKLCHDMKMQLNDMKDDLYPHGSRELVADKLAANNGV